MPTRQVERVRGLEERLVEGDVVRPTNAAIRGIRGVVTNVMPPSVVNPYSGSWFGGSRFMGIERRHLDVVLRPALTALVAGCPEMRGSNTEIFDPEMQTRDYGPTSEDRESKLSALARERLVVLWGERSSAATGRIGSVNSAAPYFSFGDRVSRRDLGGPRKEPREWGVACERRGEPIGDTVVVRWDGESARESVEIDSLSLWSFSLPAALSAWWREHRADVGDVERTAGDLVCAGHEHMTGEPRFEEAAASYDVARDALLEIGCEHEAEQCRSSAVFCRSRSGGS